ncbi:hypothetical protein EV700_2625 [Fluviicoccus keumensis]|uniref:Uncharacterized protein n=1 Tax=Fluviicoccus keumensis TaxID=1435465 RepID=A0A4Q7YMT3_9GAMM|nr:hypothetical protein [Fluviicoccus keumensis]RZU38690.1 hypothetical protein EV700_2625 [Fluviicoccus keumensis]
MHLNFSKRRIFPSVAAVLGLGLTLTAGVYAYNHWQENQPTAANFDPVVRALWEQHSGGEQGKRLCLSLPSYPAPDVGTKTREPLAWSMDFYTDAPESAPRQEQLRKLDALSQAGLLEKLTLTLNGRPAIRYRLSESGWLKSGPNRNASCFEYGQPHYLGIDQITPHPPGSQAGQSQPFYEVTARIGLDATSAESAWVRNPALLAAFPEIEKNSAGQMFKVQLVRQNKSWVECRHLVRDGQGPCGRAPTVYSRDYKDAYVDATQKDGGRAEYEAMLSRLAALRIRKMEALKAFAPPTVDEIRRLLAEMHGHGKAGQWPGTCLALPGRGNLPVDKSLFEGESDHYAVAIFPSKGRSGWDPVARKTIPYLELLERLGVMQRRAGQDIQLEDGRRQKADIFELTAGYATAVDPKRPDCLPLGVASVDIVDAQLINDDPYDTEGDAFRYKLRIKYANPPEWAKNKDLLGQWDELRGALERGRACQGEFHFDRKTRHTFGGGGSCWWAFDSLDGG